MEEMEEPAEANDIPTPAPTGLAPLDPAPTKDEVKVGTGLWLELECSQAEPNLESIFLTKGGPLAGAAARAETDFALSGSDTATVVRLSDSFATVVRIPVPATMASVSKTQSMTLDIDNRSKLLVCGSRDGAAINGTIAQTVAGQGAVYLANLFRASSGNAAIPLTYSSWAAHTAVVAASGMRIVDDSGRRFNLNFKPDEDRDKVLAAAEDLVSKWASGGWQLRTADDGLKYSHSPTLTKSVAKTPVGINDTGFDLVHNVLEMKLPYSWQTIESMISQAIQVDLEFVPEEIAQFLGDTKKPGLAATGWGRSLGAAMSMLASFLMSYRADGRVRVSTTGSESVEAESWLRQAPRTPTEANDCDGGANLTQRLVNAIIAAPADVLAKHEYINAVRNIAHPYFTTGLSVLGAASAEASGAHKVAENQQLAGHAATLMVPSLSLLRALDKGASATVGGNAVVEPSKHAEVAEARLRAIFTDDVLATLPDDEAQALLSWSTAKLHAPNIAALAIEGTTPASPLLYSTGPPAEQAAKNAAKDTAAFAKAAPNAGRSIKMLYVGGSNANDPHRFYHSFVEFSVGRSHPLWAADSVRAAGCAATQFVFSKEANRISGALTSAGTTPRELVTERFAAVPMVSVNASTAEILDYASVQSDLDVMPPRAATMTLTDYQSQKLDRSMAALATLDEALQGDENTHTDGHTVAYVLAYNTLVNNPAAVEHLCTTLKKVSTSGMVDALDVDGLASTHEGKAAGKLVIINAHISAY